VLRLISPFDTDEAVVAPVTVSIALSKSDTVSPTPILVPELVDPATKVKVVPLTTKVLPVVIAVLSEFVLAAPERVVAPVMLAGAVRLF
jgi:hypothetical protein